MSDYIKREDAEKAFDVNDLKITGSDNAQRFYDYMTQAFEKLKAIPPADVVEVVRCKYCKYSRVADMDDQEDGYLCSLLRGHEFFSYDYCSYGERRE